MIKKYWNLIGGETFLAIAWEPDFSQGCSFHRMLKNHKNFHFTQIPDKTKCDFLKKSKNHVSGSFLTIFGHFCSMRIFSKKIQLSHKLYMGPSHHAKFQKKLMSQFWENLWTDESTDGRTDGRTDPIL